MCQAVLFLRRNCSSFLNYVSRSALAVLRFAFITSLVRFQVKIYCRETRGGRKREEGKRGEETAPPFVKTFNFIWLLRGTAAALYVIYFLTRHTMLRQSSNKNSNTIPNKLRLMFNYRIVLNPIIPRRSFFFYFSAYVVEALERIEKSGCKNSISF